MIYFIPAWYQQNNWYENEQSWYVRGTHTDFDDTLKQVQLFHRSGAYPYRIMLLAFSPNFRHFLHRQSVYRAPYWSCFDAIQEVKREKARLLSVQNLNWPPEVEFVYTPFVLIAMRYGEKYAQVEYGDDGNPIRIAMYEGGALVRSNIYDDRGFLSATIVYEQEKPLYQDYLMENGARKLRHFLTDGHVEINSSYPNYLLKYEGREHTRKFAKQIYENMEEVIYEVLTSYLDLTKHEDIFCVAMHACHMKVLLDALDNRKVILSFYKERYALDSQPEGTEFMKRADYVIADSQENAQKISVRMGDTVKRLMDITPFDTRMDTGINLQFQVQKILLPVDGMSEERFAQLIRLFGTYFQKNDKAVVCLFTREAAYDRKERLLERTRLILQEAGMTGTWAEEVVEEMESDDCTEVILAKNVQTASKEEKALQSKFYVEQCVEELAVTLCVKEQRLIVDLRNVPELYMQIMAVSTGIPQIVCVENQFAIHGGNAFVLPDMGNLPEALNFYLEGLSNWNDAQISSYKIGKKYTTAVLLDKWKEVIESVG